MSSNGFINISINHTNSQSYNHGSFARVLTSTVTTLNITDGQINSTVNASAYGNILSVAYTTTSYVTYHLSNMNFTVNKLSSSTSYYGLIFYYAYGQSL